MENPFKNIEMPVENAVNKLEETRLETNTRLIKDNLELTRESENVIVLRDLESKEIKQEFEIETLKDPEDKRLDEAYDFLADTFGKNEMDSKDAVKDQMKGLRYGQKIETGGNAVIFTASRNYETLDENGEKTSKKEVVSSLDAGVISLQDENGNFTGECILMVYYIASKTSEDPTRNYRQLGLGRELLVSAYKYGLEEAGKRSMKLIGAAGECTYTSRAFWERMGWKRVYAKDGGEQGKNYKEISYIQPPLNYDLETGNPEEDSDIAPEHLMMNIFHTWVENSPQIDKKVASVVNGFYRTNNYIAPEAFGLSLDKNTNELKPLDVNTNKEEVEKSINSYKNHLTFVDSQLVDFKKQLENKRIRFLNKKQIEQDGYNVEDFITGEDEAKMLEEEEKAA